MRRLIALIVVLVVAAWIYHRHREGVVYTPPYTAPQAVQADSQLGTLPTAPKPQPTYEWQVERTDSFVMAPEVGFSGYAWPRRSPFRERLDIEAKSPVSVGYISDSYAETFRANPNELLSKPIFTCLQQHVLRTRIECGLDTSDEGFVLVMWDERSTAQMIGAGAMAALGSREAAEQAAIRNDVKITYSELRCRNCGTY